MAGTDDSSSDLQLPDDLVPEPPPPGDSPSTRSAGSSTLLDSCPRPLVYTWHAPTRSRRARSRARRSHHGDVAPRRLRALEEMPADSTGRGAGCAPDRIPGAPASRHRRLGLGVFRSCPRRYNYLRRWHLPVRPDARSWYGTMIHEVLRSAATRRMAGEDVVAETSRRCGTWHGTVARPKGRHAELRAHGEEQLRRYLESPGWIDTTIDQVEEPVTISLDHADAAGRFDRVDSRLDGIRRSRLQDRTSKEEPALRSDLQLRAYAVGLAQREQADAVAVEFHYLQGAVTRVVGDKAFLRKAHGHLSATARELALASSTGSFPPKPSRWQCQRCDFRTVCDEGRAAANSGD